MRRKRSQAIQFGNSFQIRRETPAQVKVASDSGFNSGFLFARSERLIRQKAFFRWNNAAENSLAAELPLGPAQFSSLKGATLVSRAGARRGQSVRAST